jgi:tetratricopeptide (TPR) repeat protein/DNA-binding winged helix-turn-helix (wHTH) protein
MEGVLFPVIRCGDVEIDAQQECVRHGGIEQRLRQKSFQVLLYLIENRRRVVSKGELFDAIWNDAAVTEDTLVQSVVEIRKALGDDPRSPRFVRTMPKSGYRFVAPIDDEPSDGSVMEFESVQHVEVELAEESDERTSLLPLTRDRVAMIVVALVAIGIVLSALRHGRAGGAETTGAPRRTTVAVMFFDKRNGGTDVDWLREGLSDMLITQLSRSNSLSVVSREQLAALLKRRDLDSTRTIPIAQQLEIARQAKATRLITGTYVQLGGKIRIDAQLHDVSDGKVLGGESIVGGPDELLTRIDNFSSALASRLAVPDGHPVHLAEAMTDNLEAYRLYSLGVERAQGLHNQEAIALFDQALALDPDFAMAHARIGYAYGVTDIQTERAKPYLDRALQLRDRLGEKDRLNVEAWRAIVDNHFGTAIEILRSAIARYPTEAEAYLRAGRLLVGEERLSEGVDMFERGLLVDPSSPDLYNELGAVYFDQHRMADAVAAHEKYVALAPGEPNAHDSLGLTWQGIGEYDKAIAEYDAALELDPHFEIPRVHLANTYFQTGRYRDAIREYERYIHDAQAESDRARGYNDLAWVYRKLGDTERAEELARKGASLRRDHSSSLFFFLVDRGDFAAADTLLKSIEESQSSRGTRLTLRFVYFLHGYEALKRGQRDAAIELFQHALRYQALVFSIDSYEDCLGNAYLALGRYEDAAREYRRVLGLNPNHALSHFHLADAYEHLSRRHDAKREYERFLSVWKDADRGVPEVIEARRRLASS